MQSSSISERRSFPRKVCYSEVTATCADGKVRKLLSVNCSNTGIGLVSFTPIEVGETFELAFKLKDRDTETPYVVKAEVVQKFTVRDIHMLGLRFENELEFEQSKAS